MKVLVIDGQGGGIGRAVIEQLSKTFKTLEIFAIGTNSIATSAMIKAGASKGATGENAVIHNCGRRDVDIIIGPVGICFPNSLMGEISPQMAEAITSSEAEKILIPITKCGVTILGVQEKILSSFMLEIVNVVNKRIENTENS